jgi:ABC-type bacteriocin/lantibiotic exporter with double-glycine peptidase domain
MPISVSYDVYGMSQATDRECWITAITVMVNWSQGAAFSPDQIAEGAGKTIDQVQDSEGWPGLYAIANHYGMDTLGYTPADPEAWAQAMSNGPLWIVLTGRPSHAVVLHGMSGDGSPDGTTVTVTDSVGGVQTKTWSELMQDFGAQSGGMDAEAQIMAFR